MFQNSGTEATEAAEEVATAGLQVVDLSTQVDGEEVVFILPSVLQNSTVILTLNGLVQQTGSEGDYSIDGSQITMTVAPESDDSLLVYYV